MSQQGTPADFLKSRIREVPDSRSPASTSTTSRRCCAIRRGSKAAIDSLATPFGGAGVDIVVGIESRGFILGGAVADRLGAGFCPIRKPGKLPAKTLRESFSLEYGTDSIEIHTDAIQPGQRVLVVDDVLATGGTARAAASLVKRLGGTLHGLAFLIELDFLNGREKLAGEQVTSILHY